MLLEQIERKQKAMIEHRQGPRIGVVPASQIDPKKGLRASDYLNVERPKEGKVVGLKLSHEDHERLEALMKRYGFKSKKAVLRRALEIGLQDLENPGRNPGSRG